MHVHILGICGTFMGGIARLALEKGYCVTGCDAHVYPPMSDQLREAGIEVIEGYDASQLSLAPDLFIVGNAVSRGNPLLEAILDARADFMSGPEWLEKTILPGKRVICVSGTHGKTTTTSLIVHLFNQAGLNPSFLVGGVPSGFNVSARLTESPFFVIEGDEYDTCFSDKRSKFIHYRPDVLVINNIEFDHADIFENLAAIERQFHHLVRTMPSKAAVIANAMSPAVTEVLKMGCYSREIDFNGKDWAIDDNRVVFHEGAPLGNLQIPLLGRHNASNALAAIAAANECGIDPKNALQNLQTFAGVKRRLEKICEEKGVTLYDDFAHHPTAVRETLAALKSKARGRIIAVFEPRSNTMKMGVLANALAESFNDADVVIAYQGPKLSWDVKDALSPIAQKCTVLGDIDACAKAAVQNAQAGDAILVMSNGGFGGIQGKIARLLKG